VGRIEPEYRRHGTRANGNWAGRVTAKPTKPDGTGGLREIERYPYVDPNGILLYHSVRYLKPDGKKDFRQCRPDGRGGDIWNLDGIERVPYRLPSVLKAETVYLVRKTFTPWKRGDSWHPAIRAGPAAAICTRNGRITSGTGT